MSPPSKTHAFVYSFNLSPQAIQICWPITEAETSVTMYGRSVSGSLFVTATPADLLATQLKLKGLSDEAIVAQL